MRFPRFIFSPVLRFIEFPGPLNNPSMKKLYLIGLILFSILHFRVNAQCGGGKTQCSVNWDYLDFFPSAGHGTYTDLARSQTQNFAFGTQNLRIDHNYASGLAFGENATHTAESGSFGNGEDVQFRGNGTITFTFTTAVDSIRFSIYDLDRYQEVTVNSPGANVTLSKVSGGTITFSGNNSATASAEADNTAVAVTNTNGTVNVLITKATSITTFTLTIANTGTNASENGDFWLSDISACSPGNFTSNYFNSAKPFTNQPGYTLVVLQNTVYYVNPVTGDAKPLFTDPNHTNINSLAYDPQNRLVYYVFSLSGAGGTINTNNKSLRRYDYAMDTFGVVTNDISNLIPTFEQGIESGAAAFYDGALYLGIEAKNSGSYESIVWKITFNAARVPISASQVFAINGANHDWADIGVTNGVLYNFDGHASAPDFYECDLITKNVTHYTPAAGVVPRQVSVGWDNKLYNVGPPGAGTNGEMLFYNAGVLSGSSGQIKHNGTALAGSWGDAAEAFKPKVDYGDAPASYDPATGDPAAHEFSSNLYLGSNLDDEFASRGQTIFANSDNHDDAVIMGSLVNPSTGRYFVQIRYFNNTGLPATVAAWVDFNGDGKFNSGEGKVATALPSSAVPQDLFFEWTGMASPLAEGSYTYLRLRITTAANNMTVNNATGYYNIGEVEDHRLVVTRAPLQNRIIRFDAEKVTRFKHVLLTWDVADDKASTAYVLQRSRDGLNWTDVHTAKSTADKAIANYQYLDAKALDGTSYYRLKIESTPTSYSDARKVDFGKNAEVKVWPNPVKSQLEIKVQSAEAQNGTVRLITSAGQVIREWKVQLSAGINDIPLQNIAIHPPGSYLLQVSAGTELYNQRIIIAR